MTSSQMGAWSTDSRTHVATMTHGDFRANEQAFTTADAMGLAGLVERAGLSEPLGDRAWPILAGG